jgi:uncharacterized protein YwgA
MNSLQRAAVLVSLVEALDNEGSWCGETHIQKSAYFLQELLEMPLGFSFILHKYGPYSFDLNDELAALRADEFLRLYARDPLYGPSYVPDELSKPLEERFPKTLARYKERIEFVAKTLGECGVADLERLATALYVRKSKDGLKQAEVAKRIVSLKPHISFESALSAVEQVDEICKGAAGMRI